MAQRPAGVSRVARKSANNPPAMPMPPGSPSPWSRRSGWLGHGWQFENRPGAESAPTGGEPLPDALDKPICRMCQAYPADPDWHEQWHVNLDKWARGVNDELAAMRRFLQQLGYIATNEKATATDGNSEENGHA